MTKIYTYINGPVKEDLTDDSLKKLSKKKIWIDLKNPSDEDFELMKKKFRLHPTTIEDIRTHNTRTKIEEFSNYLYVVIYDLVKDSHGEFVRSEIDIIIGRYFVITNTQRRLPELDDLKNKPRKLGRVLISGTDNMLHYIIDSVMSHYMPTIEDIDEEIDNLERKVADNPKRHILDHIMKIRNNIIFIKRLIHPHLDKIGLMAKKGFRQIREEKLPYFRDLYDDSFRINEAIDMEREEIHSLYDLYMSTLSYNTNEIMKVLSIAATIVLPLTLITGLYGMNFNKMPGLGNPFGFWITCIVMVALAAVMLVFFRKEKWI